MVLRMYISKNYINIMKLTEHDVIILPKSSVSI